MKIKTFFRRIYDIIKQPTMSILPGQIAFSLIISIIPLIVFLGMIVVGLSLSLENLILFIQNTFPSQVSDILLPLISGKGFDVSMIFFLASGTILATAGAYSIIISSNLIYEVEKRNILKSRIKSIIIIFILMLLVCFLIIVPGFGDKIIVAIKLLNISDLFYKILKIIYNIVKFPLSFLLIYFNVKLIYTMAPDKKIKSKSVTLGSLFTTILWIILTKIYSYFVSNIVQYDIFYGSLSNIIIFFIWMYFISYVFVIGLVLNAQSLEVKDEKNN